MPAAFSPYDDFVCPLAPQERGAALRAWCAEGRAYWQRQHREGASGSDVGQGLAHMMRRGLVSIFLRAYDDERAKGDIGFAALGVMGSLGRRELSPYSDLDVLLLVPRTDTDAVRRLADAVFYPLWDARLEVGHAVRTPSEFARLAIDDDTVRTAAVDFCPLAGDDELIGDLIQRLDAALKSAATRRYALASVRAWTADGNAGTIYKLQPEIKAGPGGLREMHRVWWLGRLLFKIDSWHDFLSRGLIDAHGFDILVRGREALFDIRLAMHWAAGRRQDELRFDVQDDVASLLRLPAGPGGRSAADNLLAHFYKHAKAVRVVSSQVLLRCAEQLEPARRISKIIDIEGFDRLGQALTLHRVDQFDAAPIDLLRIVRVAQRYKLHLLVHARARIAEAAPRLIDAKLRQDARAARLFVQMLADPADGGATLETLHELGILEHFMPEFHPVTGLTQRDLYHVHTVDAHLVACARLALRVLGGQAAHLTPDAAEASETPQTPDDLQAMAERVSRPHVFVLAALMHDIGKGHGHSHSERGAQMAEGACARLGLDPEDAQDVVWLVLEHLTLYRVSQRRDLEDEALIARLASNMMTLERLELLMLISYVDAQTTGPKAWNAWKHQLLRELYERVRQMLIGGASAASLTAKAQSRLNEVRALAPKSFAYEQLVALLPPRHFVAHRPALVLRHLEAMHKAAAKGPVVRIDADTARWVTEVIVISRDRAGLLSDLSGVLAAWGMQVESAHIATTQDHWAVDTFVLRDAEAFMQKPERVKSLIEELETAALTSTAIEARLEERRRARAYGATGAPHTPTRMVFDLDAVDGVTVLDVFAADRVGLLHDMTHALFEAGTSIVLARISTEGERAIDAFYLLSRKTAQRLDVAERLAVQVAIQKVTEA